MKIRSRTLVSIAIFVVLGCSCTEQESAAANDEIIVRFAAGQSINDTIVRAFDDSSAEKTLKKSVHALSDELDVPLEYSRFTSGREIVMQIPTDRVIDKVLARLRNSDDVKDVVLESRAANGVQDSPRELHVTIDRSRIESVSDIEPNALAARLVADDRLPVTCEIRADGRLVISPDFERLVAELTEELASRPDIDYAQPNFAVRHYNKNQ